MIDNISTIQNISYVVGSIKLYPFFLFFFWNNSVVLWHSNSVTLANYLEQEGIAHLLFWVCLNTMFSSTEVMSWDESSSLLDNILDMFFTAPSLANLPDISFQERPQWDSTQQNPIQIPLCMIQCIKYFTS